MSAGINACRFFALEDNENIICVDQDINTCEVIIDVEFINKIEYRNILECQL